MTAIRLIHRATPGSHPQYDRIQFHMSEERARLLCDVAWTPDCYQELENTATGEVRVRVRARTWSPWAPRSLH
jgi:hypothetical protein